MQRSRSFLSRKLRNVVNCSIFVTIGQFTGITLCCAVIHDNARNWIYYDMYWHFTVVPMFILLCCVYRKFFGLGFTHKALIQTICVRLCSNKTPICWKVCGWVVLYAFVCGSVQASDGPIILLSDTGVRKISSRNIADNYIRLKLYT